MKASDFMGAWHLLASTKRYQSKHSKCSTPRWVQAARSAENTKECETADLRGVPTSVLGTAGKLFCGPSGHDYHGLGTCYFMGWVLATGVNQTSSGKRFHKVCCMFLSLKPPVHRKKCPSLDSGEAGKPRAPLNWLAFARLAKANCGSRTWTQQR